jgi:hypothetical protein
VPSSISIIGTPRPQKQDTTKKFDELPPKSMNTQLWFSTLVRSLSSKTAIFDYIRNILNCLDKSTDNEVLRALLSLCHYHSVCFVVRL